MAHHNVGAEMVVEGVVRFHGVMEVAGAVRGALIGLPANNSEVVIHQGAVMHGEIVAARVTVAGEVVGPVTASVSLTVESTGRLHGEVRHREIDLMRGSVVTGRLVPLDESLAALPLDALVRDLPDESGAAETSESGAA